MAELAIRRNRSFAVPLFQGTVKTEKQTGQKAVKSPGYTVSPTLRQYQAGQAESNTRASRRTLQTGESVLSEVKDSLDRIADLARQSAGGGKADRAALQAQLELLRADIDRMIGSAASGGTPLFLDKGEASELEALLAAIDSAAGEEGQALPDWLLTGIALNIPSADRLLGALGLNQSASGADILAAIRSHPLESSSAAASLATLYLGAAIANGEPTNTFDPQEALEGIQMLLDKIAEGVPLDEAIAQLTSGAFTSLADFEAQFTGGTAPGLEDFLVNLLLTDAGSLLPTATPLLSLLAGMESANLDLLMGLLTLPEGSGASLELAGTDVPESSQAAEEGEAASSPSVLQLEKVQVTGRDLSGVSFQAETNTLTISGSGDVTIQGAGQGGGMTILVTGSGAVTLQNAEVSALIFDTAAARLFTAGTNLLGELRLSQGTSLTLGGNGLVRLAGLTAGQTNTVRLTGGAVILEQRERNTVKVLTVPIVVEHSASLAAQASSITSADGKPLEAFDLVWKTLLPNWSSLTSVAVNDKQTRMALLNGDPVRLWLNKGDSGYPIQTLVLRGRDAATGLPQTRYAYVRWNQYTRSFETVSMFPNPFTVTGGEVGKDWVYEQESHTLRILSNRVTAISGGAGTDTNQTPFSGRIALADGIGPLALALSGVVCQVSSGRAFDLGRENDVTLLLKSGTANRFESGSGFAGISVGDGTTLRIDCASPEGDGALTAAGADGGAGIGRDSETSRDQISEIFIRSGIVTAIGTGGGAGIGAGKQSFMGSITILGGTVDATGGEGGGAGIGAALGASVWDINIRGGNITAAAVHHAAAIGAAVQGECGNIFISGTARILKAAGGSPGADIGACLFGGCGQVRISGEADIGSAKLSTYTGIPLQMGEDSVTLPQFALSAGTLQLDTMSVLTPEEARSAQAVLNEDQKWVSQIQDVYDALRNQLEQSFGNLRSVHQYINLRANLVRDPSAANALLADMRRSILQSSQAMLSHGGQETEDVQQLLQ